MCVAIRLFWTFGNAFEGRNNKKRCINDVQWCTKVYDDAQWYTMMYNDVERCILYIV